MNNANVAANMDAIRKLGQQVQSQSAEYNGETKKIYASVDQLEQAWTGADNQTYIGKVKEQRQTIEDLGKVIDNFGIFLVDTANNLQKVQDEIKAQAGKL